MVLYSTLHICAKIRKTNEVSILHFCSNFIKIGQIYKKPYRMFG